MQQQTLFSEADVSVIPSGRPAGQLLKWIGNKHRYAPDIIGLLPRSFGTYFEPFLGSGAVLGHLGPKRAVASDVFEPLINIWKALKDSPEIVKDWYSERYLRASKSFKTGYIEIRDNYNKAPNPADLLFLCRACYGGVMRFRKVDGYMSTPCGIHIPISPKSFNRRVDSWFSKVRGATFVHCDYTHIFDQASFGDVIYCDPPYSHSQAILYGAQSFSLEKLLRKIDQAKKRGVYVILSIDGTKKSGDFFCEIPIPKGLFRREIFIECGRSMLKRFQMEGKSLENETVQDRLLLTY